jgi:hypothetical protein
MAIGGEATVAIHAVLAHRRYVEPGVGWAAFSGGCGSLVTPRPKAVLDMEV